MWPKLLDWLEESPLQNEKMLLHRLQREYPGEFEGGQLWSLQRRTRQWRLQRARKLVFGVHNGAVAAGLEALSHALISEGAAAETSQTKAAMQAGVAAQ